MSAACEREPVGPEPADEGTSGSYLEPQQLVSAMSRPAPRIGLSRRTSAWLWGLRAAVTVLAALVIYTFVAQLT